MNEPLDHHYLPVFYLSRWAGADKRVCRYSRPHGREVKTKRVVPKGTGFEPGLYEISGLPPDRAQIMEKDFLARLDSRAAEALALLESGLPEQEWASQPRSSWSRFLLTQLLRAPEDIAQLKSSVKQDWGKAMPELEAAYAMQRSDSDPVTVREYLEQQNHSQTDEAAFRVGRKLMNHTNICQSINNMHWLVIDVAKEEFAFLTSDRPVSMTSTLTESKACIMMPIGPTKLFAGVVKDEMKRRLLAKKRGDLVKAVNKAIVQRAVNFVYGQTDVMLRFVQKHMATKQHPSLLERLARKRGHKVAADSPDAT